jgi:hypothetical protein
VSILHAYEMRIGLLFYCMAVATAHADDLPADRIAGVPAVAVSSTVETDYVRVKLPDGSIKPETYVVRRGVCQAGCIHDDSFDSLAFKDIVRIVAGSLVRQRYLPARDPNAAKLLIEIHWGTSAGRDQNEFRDAAFMGYDDVLEKAMEAIGPAKFRYDPILDELKGSGSFGRYFIALVAYDYQLLRTQRVEKALWMTPFSISGRGNAFNEQVVAMASTASQYFGEATNGLIHEKVIPEGRVEVGEPKSLGDVPEK